MTDSDATGSARTLVVVPTYNERDNIEEVARRLFAAAGGSVDLLVVDDASPDRTADRVRRMAETTEGIHLIERTHKMGLGSAYIAAFDWARERGYAAIVEMDGDLSHDPGAVPGLLSALEHADVVIGSRYVPGGAIRNWGLVRRALSWLGNAYARVWLRTGVRDMTSGFRAYKASVLSAHFMRSLSSDGYVFQIEMVRRAHRAGATISEMPIVFSERPAGESKISRRIVLEAIVKVTAWGVKDLSRRRSPR